MPGTQDTQGGCQHASQSLEKYSGRERWGQSVFGEVAGQEKTDVFLGNLENEVKNKGTPGPLRREDPRAQIDIKKHKKIIEGQRTGAVKGEKAASSKSELMQSLQN